MDCLNILRVVVPPCPAHAAGMDMVGYDVAIISEHFVTEGALATLGGNLPVEEFPHFSVSSGVPGIPWGDEGLRCAERPSGADAFLLVLTLSHSRNGSGGSGRVDSGEVSWCSLDWLECNGAIVRPAGRR